VLEIDAIELYDSKLIPLFRRKYIIATLFFTVVCLGALITLNVHRMSQDGGVQLFQARRAEKLYYTDRGMTPDEIVAVHKSKVCIHPTFHNGI
jgi:hypothetical protein